MMRRWRNGAFLYKLAGLPVAEAETYARLQQALGRLSGARFAIVKQLLEGKIDDAEAARLTKRPSACWKRA